MPNYIYNNKRVEIIAFCDKMFDNWVSEKNARIHLQNKYNIRPETANKWLKRSKYGIK